jgi:ribulose-5-phosphate 4-epimerase/fuculose-1-phosphate aldolase
MTMSDLSGERELVARACRMIGNLGVTKAATGHISRRVDGGFLVRARGLICPVAALVRPRLPIMRQALATSSRSAERLLMVIAPWAAATSRRARWWSCRI